MFEVLFFQDDDGVLDSVAIERTEVLILGALKWANAICKSIFFYQLLRLICWNRR